MTDYVKPPVKPAWGESNTSPADMVTPTDPEIQAGWPLSPIPPSRQRFNWFQNYVMNGVRYFMQRGLADWDAAESYVIGARIIGDDGKTYKSLTTNTNSAPSANPDDWELWGFSLSEMFAQVVKKTAATGSALLPVGSTAQRDGTPSNGMVRYNTTINKFEGYGNSTWGSLGGGATGGGTDEVFLLCGNTVNSDYTIPAEKNALVAGPLTINAELDFGTNSTLTLV